MISVSTCCTICTRYMISEYRMLYSTIPGMISVSYAVQHYTWYDVSIACCTTVINRLIVLYGISIVLVFCMSRNRAAGQRNTYMATKLFCRRTDTPTRLPKILKYRHRERSRCYYRSCVKNPTPLSQDN